MKNKMISAFDWQPFVQQLATSCGVYQMVDDKGAVIYVGKACNLKARVSSYFKTANQSGKTKVLVRQIHHIDIIATSTEAEALLLESNLIKSLKPRYNVILRDDKSYPFIHLSIQDDFPRIALFRGKKVTKKAGRYFGPYPSVHTAKETIALLQKIFLIRDCKNSYFRHRARPCLQYQINRCSAPCVQYIRKEDYKEAINQIILFLQGKSQAVLQALENKMTKASKGMQFESAAVLRDNIQSLRTIQLQQAIINTGGDADVIAQAVLNGTACVDILSIREGLLVKQQSFFPIVPKGFWSSEKEKTDSNALANEILRAFIQQYYLQISTPIPKQIITTIPSDKVLIDVLQQKSSRGCEWIDKPRGKKAKWLTMAKNNAQMHLNSHLSSKAKITEQMEDLSQILQLKTVPTRMECFDISHTSGEETVASCVVFNREGPLKSDYRRFNIKNITASDDYAAMRQAIMRRYKRLQQETKRLPDVLFVDGGKGQVRQAIEVFNALGIDSICLVGVAKGPDRKAGLETLLLSQGQKAVSLAPDRKALHLIQFIRDEAHRFAITGHKNKRDKKRQQSVLEAIEGIGAKKRQALLKRFGGLQGIACATLEELMKVDGINHHLAQKIFQAFN